MLSASLINLNCYSTDFNQLNLRIKKLFFFTYENANFYMRLIITAKEVMFIPVFVCLFFD